MTEEYLTANEVAALLRMTKGALYQWRGRGTGPPWFMAGGHYLYPRADVEAWIAAQREAAKS